MEDFIKSNAGHLKQLLLEGDVISEDIATSFLRREKEIEIENSENLKVLGTKMNKQVDLNKRLKTGSTMTNIPLKIAVDRRTEPVPSEFEENELLLPGEPLNYFAPEKGTDCTFQRVVSHVTSVYDYEEHCLHDISKCPGGAGNWYKRRYGDKEEDESSYFNDALLQQVMPIVWLLAVDEDQESKKQKLTSARKRPWSDDFDFYRDIVDVERKVEKAVVVKIQESPLLCPFYYSLYTDSKETQVLQKIFQAKKAVVSGILEIISTKMVSSFETLIGYILENDIDSTRKEEMIIFAKDILKEIFAFLGFANYVDFESNLDLDVKLLGSFVIDQVVEDDQTLVKMLQSFNANTLKNLLGVLKKIVSSNFTLVNLEKISYIYRGFRKLLQMTQKDKNVPSGSKAKLTADVFEPYFKKKGNFFLSQYEDVSSSLRVYIRINTGPPPGVTSPFYENVRNVTSLKPYSKKRSCQSIEDCSVAPAIKGSTGKSIIYRKTEGYDGVFHRMLASDKNPINTQDIFKECYSSTELLTNMAIEILITDEKVKVKSGYSTTRFTNQLSEYLNKEIVIGNGTDSVVYDISTDELRKNPIKVDQIFVTLCSSIGDEKDRVSCQITKIVSSSTNEFTITLECTEPGASLDASKHKILVFGNLKSLVIDSTESFSSSNEGMTEASFGTFQEVYESVNRHLDKGYDANKEIYYGNCSYLIGYDEAQKKILNIERVSNAGKLFTELFDETQSFFLNKAILLDEKQNSSSQQPELNRLRLVPVASWTNSTNVSLTFRDMMTLSKRNAYGKFPFQLVSSEGGLLEASGNKAISLGSTALKYILPATDGTTKEVVMEITISKEEPFSTSVSSLPNIINHEYYTYMFKFQPSLFTEMKLEFFSLGTLFYESEIMDDKDLLKAEDKGLFRLLQGQFLLQKDGDKPIQHFAFAIDTYDFESAERRNYFDNVVALKKTNEGLCDLVSLVKENCSGFTIFGYGYSGTGKSYTLFGDASKNLFERVRSCFELYVKNMKALGITSPQFMSLQMVINKIKAKIVSTEGIPIYNVPRGDMTKVYGYTWSTNGRWNTCEYTDEEISFRYGLPHPVLIKNIRLLQDQPSQTKTLSELKKVADRTVVFMVKDDRFLVDNTLFLCIEAHEKFTYAVPYYGNFNLDDILICEDRDVDGNLYMCENCTWDETKKVERNNSQVGSNIFQGSLVLKKEDGVSKVIPIDDGLRFFIDDYISGEDILDTWAEADSKKVMLIVSYLQWYILEDLYNTIELVGSRESYSMKRGVLDRLNTPLESEYMDIFEKELLSSDEKEFKEAAKRRNKIPCLYKDKNAEPNKLFTGHVFQKEKDILTPFQKSLTQRIEFLSKRKISISTEVGELMERFRELNHYVPNKGMSLATGYGQRIDNPVNGKKDEYVEYEDKSGKVYFQFPIAKDKLNDDITYYDLTTKIKFNILVSELAPGTMEQDLKTHFDVDDKSVMFVKNANLSFVSLANHDLVKAVLDREHVIKGQKVKVEKAGIVMNYPNFSVMHYLVYKYDIFKKFGISSGEKPSYQGVEENPPDLNLSHNYLIKKSIERGEFGVFSTFSDESTLPSIIATPWIIEGVEITSSMFSNDKLYALLKYFFTSPTPEDFLGQTFDFNFDLQEEEKTIFVRLADIQDVLRQLYDLRTEYKTICKELETFLQPLMKEVENLVNRTPETNPVTYTKMFTCEPSFHMNDGTKKLTLSKEVKKTDFLDIVLKLQDETKRGDVEGGYHLEDPDTYVEQSISYFHLFHIPSTKMETGVTKGKGPVYGFVQLTMKNLIESGYTVKMYAAFDLYGTMKNPTSDNLVADSNQLADFLTNGVIMRYNFLRDDNKRYEDDLLFGSLQDQPETNLTKEMSESLIKVCAEGFKTVDDIASFYDLLQKIEKKRIEVGCIKPTPNNPQSSRGHLFLIFEVTRNSSVSEDDKWFSAPGEPPKKTYITVIDMAGVENPLTIAQKVNTFEKGMNLSEQKKNMFTWYSEAGGYKLLDKCMTDFKTDVSTLPPVSQIIVPYQKASILRPLFSEKEKEFTSLKELLKLKVETIQKDIQNLVKYVESSKRSTFYTSKFTFFAGFKICDTLETCYRLVKKILELIHFQTILDQLSNGNPSNTFNKNFDVKLSLTSTYGSTATTVTVSNFEHLGIKKDVDYEITLCFSYEMTPPISIPESAKMFIQDHVNKLLKYEGNRFSYTLTFNNTGNKYYEFSKDFFNKTIKTSKLDKNRQVTLSSEILDSYIGKYCTEEYKAGIRSEEERFAIENKYEDSLEVQRTAGKQISAREVDSCYLDRYTLHSFFENYQKQENETGSFVDANFLYFRLKGFPLKKWLKTYFSKNQGLEQRFTEDLSDSGFGLQYPDGTTSEKLTSYLLVETLMDEDVFKEMLTLGTDFVKIGDKNKGIHNQEFLKRKAKDDYEKIDSEIERLGKSGVDQDILAKNKLIMKKQVLQYLYYYTPWWGGSILFKTDESGMGFSVNQQRLKDHFIEKIFELQKHCLIALIEQIINEGYFINETISHIVTYFKHTSRGVSDSEALRLHDLKGKLQPPVPLTHASATDGNHLKSKNYFVDGSTQINPKYLLADLEKEYVPIINPLKAKHLRKVYELLFKEQGSSRTKAQNQMLFTVYKTALELNDIEMRQKQSQRRPMAHAGGELKKVTVNLLDNFKLNLVLTEEPTVEKVDRKVREELNLEKVSFDNGQFLVEKQNNNFEYKLSGNMSNMLQRYVTDSSVLQDVIKKVKCDSTNLDEKNITQQKCLESAKLYMGPSQNRDLFSSTLQSFLDEVTTLDYTLDVDDTMVSSLKQSLKNVEPEEDTTFEPFSNYYRDFKEDSIDNFDSAMQTQLSNTTNTVKMIPLLQYLKNLTGGKCKYVMLCLIRPEIKAQYCEGARKGLQFAQAVASTSSKDTEVSKDQSGQGLKTKTKTRKRTQKDTKQSIKRKK